MRKWDQGINVFYSFKEVFLKTNLSYVFRLLSAIIKKIGIFEIFFFFFSILYIFTEEWIFFFPHDKRKVDRVMLTELKSELIFTYLTFKFYDIFKINLPSNHKLYFVNISFNPTIYCSNHFLLNMTTFINTYLLD